MLSFITLVYFLEFGFSPVNQMEVENNFYREENFFYAEFDADIYLFDTVFVGGAIKSQFRPDPDTDFQFLPSVDSYTFRAGLDFGNVLLAVEHLCMHPISLSWLDPIDVSMAYTNFFIRFGSQN